MTGPRIDFDLLNSYVNGPEADRENQYYLKLQQDLLRQMLEDLKLGGQEQQADFSDVSGGFGSQAPTAPLLGQGLNPLETLFEEAKGFFRPIGISGADPEMAQRLIAGVDELNQMELPALHGRAKALGIDNPERIPLAELKQMIAERRLDVAPTNINPLRNIASHIARLGIGGAEMALHFSRQAFAGAEPSEAQKKNMPAFLADLLNQQKNEAQSTEWLAKLSEGVRMNQDPSQLGPIYSAVPGFVGGLAVGIGVGKPIYEALGAMYGGVMASLTGKAVGPIMRGTVAGIGTSLSFDSGSDKPWLPTMADLSKVVEGDMHAENRVLLGAQTLFSNRATSAAIGGMLGAIAGRAARDFPSQRASEDAHNNALSRVVRGRQAEDAIDDPNIVDAVWEWAPAEPTAPLPFNRRLGGGSPAAEPAGPMNIAALEQRYLRRLPDEPSGPVAPVDLSVPPPVAGYLQGPLTPEGADLASMSYYQQGEVFNPVMHRVVQDFPRAVTSIDDIAPRILALRERAYQIEQQHWDEQNQYPLETIDAEVRTDGTELNSVYAEIKSLREAAGMKPSDPDPDPWTHFRKNPPSPATPSRDLADQYGTLVRLPDGRPKVMYHGTAAAFDDFDPERLAKSENLVGPGAYITDNPFVAGGNPIVGEPGYAQGRADAIEADRQYLSADILRIKDQIATLEAQPPDQFTDGPAGWGVVGGADDTAARTNSMQIEALRNTLADYEQRLAALPEARPNVRMVYAAVKNPFQFDKPIPLEEAMQVLRVAQEHHPEFDWNSVAQQVQEISQTQGTDNPYLGERSAGSVGMVPGQSLYERMAYLTRELPHGTFDDFGKAGVNRVLQDAGYDSIKYDGGLRTGGGAHDAYNVFEPRHLIPVFLGEEHTPQAAAALGIQMGKQQAILESPALDELAQSSQFTDGDVVVAQVTATPGAFNLIRGITDPAGVGQYLAGDTGLGGALRNFRFLLAPDGRVDLLVSSFGEITDSMAAAYEKYGLFPGQDVISKTGKLGKLVRIEDDNHVWRSNLQKGNRVSNAKPGTLTPQNTGEAVLELPGLYDQFKIYAMQETAQRINSTGQTYVPMWWDEAVFKRLPELVKTFLDVSGISEIGTRAAIARGFDQLRIADAEMIAQHEFSALDDLRGEVEDLAQYAEAADRGPDAFDYAALRGFNLVPNEGKPGYVLEDLLSEAKLPMESEEAVREFLNHYQRDLPDYTPATPLPMEIADVSNDSGLNHSPNGDDFEMQLMNDIAVLESEWDGTFVDEPWGRGGLGDEEPTGVRGPLPDYASGSFSRIPGHDWQGQQYTTGGGGGGQPPTNPPPAGALPDEPNYARLGSGKHRDMVRRDLRGMEGKMGDLMKRYEGAIAKLLTPMRTNFSNLQSDLAELGMQNLKPWNDFDDIVSGMTRAHNEANPILNEVSHEMRFVKARHYRNGLWWQLWEVPDPIDRIAHARRMGFTDEEAKSFYKVDTILNDMIGGGYEDVVRQFKTFVSKARTAQSRGDYSPAGYGKLADYPAISWYAEHAMDTGARYLRNDPRVLLTDFVRTYTFNKHAGEAWNRAHDTWRAVESTRVYNTQPFRPLARTVLDWMDYVQRGYQPGSDYALTAFQSVFNNTIGRLTGAPLSRAEARNFIQMMQTGFYRAQMGIRVHVMVRDAIQPTLALAFVDGKHLAGAYKTAAGGASRNPNGSLAKNFEGMLQRAFDAGVAEQGLPQLESPGIFEGIVRSTDEGGTFTPEEMAARDKWAGYLDTMKEILAPGGREFVKRNLDTMRFYTKQGTWHRILVGEAAYQNFIEKFVSWDIERSLAVQEGLPGPSFQQFASDINLNAWGTAENGKIQDLLSRGENQEAAHVYMRLIADRTQFAYGSRHAAPGVRTTAGKLGMMLGNFTTQLGDAVRNTARMRSIKAAAKGAAILGLLDKAFEMLEDETGWPTRYMSPLYAFTFLGGPIIEKGADIYETLRDVQDVSRADYYGRPIPNAADQRLKRLSVPGAIAGSLQGINPLAGVGYNMRGLSQITSSDDPLYSAGRFLVTGAAGGEAVDNARRIMAFPEMQQLINGAPVPPPTSLRQRGQTVPMRLPGVNQYQGLNRTGDAAVDSIQDQVIRTENVIQDFVKKVPGAGAF